MEHINAAIARAAQRTGTLAPEMIPPHIATFDFEFEGYNGETQAVLEHVRDWLARMVIAEKKWRDDWAATLAEYESQKQAAMEANEIPPDEPIRPKIVGNWLTLCGPSGIGKTHLARKIADWRWSRTQNGSYFYTWLNMIRDARNGHTDKIRDRARSPRLMVIDDAGAGHDTDFSHAFLSEIAELRMDRYTVFTSNLNAGDFAEIDTRIASRMVRGENEVFEFRSTGDYAFRHTEAQAS